MEPPARKRPKREEEQERDDVAEAPESSSLEMMTSSTSNHPNNDEDDMALLFFDEVDDLNNGRTTHSSSSLQLRNNSEDDDMVGGAATSSGGEIVDNETHIMNLYEEYLDDDDDDFGPNNDEEDVDGDTDDAVQAFVGGSATAMNHNTNENDNDNDVEEEEEDIFNGSILTILDPIQSVARKSLHKTDQDHLLQQGLLKSSNGDDDDNIKSLLQKNGGGAVTTTTHEDEGIADDVDKSDILSSMTDDVIWKITSFLNARDLLLGLGLVNHTYHELCIQDAAGWDTLCEQLWSNKCHVSREMREMVLQPQRQRSCIINTNNTNNNMNQHRRLAAYRRSLIDAQRQHVTMRELCYDPESPNSGGTIWSFRFKASAGTDWTSVDPWYLGQPCRKIVFLRDFTMKQVQYVTNDNTNTLQQPGEGNNNNTISSSSSTSTIELVDPPLPMTWRFLTRPMDLPTRPLGSYIRIKVGGRDVPTYAVRRSPTGNWGFVLESCWGIYGSFELPPRRTDTTTTTTRTVPNATATGGRRPGGATTTTTRTTSAPEDMQDDSMSLTNEVQWREAFLYNVGARVLPEGEEATDEFDRLWQGA